MIRFLPLLLLTACSQFYYFPSAYKYSDPKIDLGIDYQEVEFSSLDKTTLYAWVLKSAPGPKKILFLQFHGNAENMTSHYQSLAWVVKEGHDLITFDYRGYGRSDGVPDPLKVRDDAISFLEFSREIYLKNKYSHLVVVGQSLGGAIAMDALSHWSHLSEVNFLVLDSTFDSYSNAGFQVLKSNFITFLFSPLAYLILDTSTNPNKTFDKLSMPKLVLHGKLDPIVPYSLGRELFEELPEPKMLRSFRQGSHIDAFHRSPEIRKELIDLVTSWPSPAHPS